jgi:hypothetical protein
MIAVHGSSKDVKECGHLLHGLCSLPLQISRLGFFDFSFFLAGILNRASPAAAKSGRSGLL